MKRLLVPLFISGYLGLLVYGLFSHALNYNNDRHVGMYFLVWDMYCGWSAYETRQHVLAEGESGTYYDVTSPPWESITPYGEHPRQTHDYAGIFAIDMARNVLRHTRHEPITRLLLVDEAWPRKYNLPDELWPRRYAEPKDKLSYFQVRRVATPDGRVLQDKPSWSTQLAHDTLMDNPRLRRDISGTRRFYAVSPGRDQQRVVPTSYELPVE